MSKRKHARAAADVAEPQPTMNDVLSLNIGGQRLDVLRSTICLVEGSMLATKFSGRWDEGIPKDRDGNFFIDEPYELFKTMVDFLRMKSRELVAEPETAPLFCIESDRCDCLDQKVVGMNAFRKMVDYYGCTAALWPVFVHRLGGGENDDTFKKIEWPETSIECLQSKEDVDEKFVLWFFDHNRLLKGFDVRILEGDVSLVFHSDKWEKQIDILPSRKGQEVCFWTPQKETFLAMPDEALDILYGNDADLRHTRKRFREGVAITLTFEKKRCRGEPVISVLKQVSIGDYVVVSLSDTEKNFAHSNPYGWECDFQLQMNQPGHVEITNLAYFVSNLRAGD